MGKRINKNTKPNLKKLEELSKTPPLISRDKLNIPEPERIKHTAIGIHAVNNFFSSSHQPSLFSNPEENSEKFSKIYGLDLFNKIDKYGIDLTDFQFKVMEGLLRAFKHSKEIGYKGNTEDKDKMDLLKENKYIGKNLPVIYNNISKIPRVILKQSEVIRLTGAKENSIAERQRTIEALNYLTTTQFLYYYHRLSKDSSGKPIKDEKGKYKKEEVMAVDTLFTIKIVRDEETKEFKYYEVEPSAIFLDQIESYYLLIPNNWREEIKMAVGGKEVSSYTMKFLLWLRYQYEEKRRKNYNGMEIRLNWESIAKTLKMPETIYIRNRKRAIAILDKAYETALQTGYLLSYRREEVDILELNPDKYYNPQLKIKT